MKGIVNINGTLLEPAEAKVSVFDHGYLYGDGVFEGLRIYAGKVFKKEEHLIRLYDSAKVLMLTIPWSLEEMDRQLEKTLQASGLEEGYIRLVVSRGEGTLGIDPAKCLEAQVVIIMGTISLYPEEYYKKGIAIVTASTRRNSPDILEGRVKSLNYMNNILAKLEAKTAGCMEAVMLSKEGYVVECTADNLFIVKNQVLYTPDPVVGALDGITRQTVLELASLLGLTTKECWLSRYDLYTADECFMTGSGAEIVPVVLYDGRMIGTGKPGAVTERIRKSFRELVLRG